MTSSTTTSSTTATPGTAARRAPAAWARLRGVLAGTAVLGFFAIAVAAPFTAPSEAMAEEQEFQQRIHQEFSPADAADQSMDLAISPLVKIEEKKPEAPADQQAAAPTPGLPPYTGGGSPAKWMAAAGIPESDWRYVDYVVTRESGWNPNATNSGSGACGLVQALPCSKVPGNGYDPVDNLRWADGYAKGRYGSWKGAYDFWIANNWW
ncbi:MAG: transglycosylase SLT domain-containing protein [Actinobacteria bacterium]|nr:transglycosylase SLT domain-containing protein [Actinomycetota bacterium]